MRSNFFSRAQQWRRTLIRHQRVWEASPEPPRDWLPSERENCKQEAEENLPPTASPSNASVITSEERKDDDEGLFADVDDADAGESKTASFNVKFNPTTEIALIPSRKEFGPQLKDLFWHQEDYDLFKQDAVGEIRMYWRLSGTSAKEAIIALYQPEYDNNELVVSILYHGDPLSIPPSPMRFDESTDSYRCEDDEECELEEAVIEGTVMKHVDSLSSLHQHGFETDSESSVASSSMTDGLSFSPTSQVGFDLLQPHGGGYYPCPPTSYAFSPKPIVDDHQRVAHGGVWIDSEGDSDSIVSDSMDYDM